MASPDRSGGVGIDTCGRFAALPGRHVDLDRFWARPGSRPPEDRGFRNRHVAALQARALPGSDLLAVVRDSGRHHHLRIFGEEGRF